MKTIKIGLEGIKEKAIEDNVNFYYIVVEEQKGDEISGYLHRPHQTDAIYRTSLPSFSFDFIENRDIGSFTENKQLVAVLQL